ncbi:17163_t:CDS:2, partial [Cetraspora pellucida]
IHAGHPGLWAFLFALDAQALIDLWGPILVVSVDLDTWTTEQVENMTQWGNAKANLNIDSWIRSKYELKRWAMKGPIPDPATLGDGYSNKSQELPSSTKIVNESQISERSSLPSKTNENNILDIFAPSSISNVPSNNPSSVSQLKGADLFSIGQPSLSSNVPSNPVQENSNPQATHSSTSTSTSNHDTLKSSILSLYNSPNLKPNTLPQSFPGNFSSPNLPLRNANNSTPPQNANRNGNAYMNDLLGGFM